MAPAYWTWEINLFVSIKSLVYRAIRLQVMYRVWQSSQVMAICVLVGFVFGLPMFAILFILRGSALRDETSRFVRFLSEMLHCVVCEEVSDATLLHNPVAQVKNFNYIILE